MAVAIKDRLRTAAQRRTLDVLRSAGHSPRSLEDAKREIRWWLAARSQAGATLTPRLLRGQSLSWSGNGYVELVDAEVPLAGVGQVTVLVDASAVNVGTERAQYLRLPNTSRASHSRPGSSAAGVVVAVGPRVVSVSLGDRVAVTDVPHASLATVPAEQVFVVPAGVATPAAALVKLGAISGQGVRLAEISSGARFGVVGAGIIGALALRIGAAAGGQPEAVVATSRSKEPLARAGGARRFLVTGEDAEALSGLELPVVIEATGDPRAISVAVDAAAPGGRVLLLGSSRGVSPAVPIAAIRRKRLEIVGAHVDTLDFERARAGGEPRRREAERFLRLVADGSVQVEDLAGPAVDPRESALFFRRLADDPALVGAHFDWTRLSPTARKRPGRFARLPDVSGRGMAIDRLPVKPAPPRRAPARSVFALPDPFAGASGDLRIGMLGCGDIAVHNAGGIAGAPNARLVACFDPVRELAVELAAQHGADTVSTAEELVEHPAVDAVFVAVPHHLHAPLARLAIDAGRHVIVEKPPANDLAAAVEMTRAADGAGVVLSICFPQRYEPSVAIARQLIEHGALGEFGGSTVKAYLDKGPGYWTGGFSGRSQSTWRSSRDQAGGGVLIMNACHYVDAVRHLAGVEADEVTALASTVDGDVEVEDAISVSVSYRNGAIGTLIGHSAVRGTTTTEMSLWGSDGHVVVEPRARAYSLRPIDGMRTTRWHSFGRPPKVNARAVYVSRLATAIDRGTSPDVTSADALAVQAFIAAAYRSSVERRAVRPLDLLAEARG